MATFHGVTLLLWALARTPGTKAGYACTLYTEYASRCFEPADAITVIYGESLKNGICFAPRLKECRLMLTRRRENCQRVVCSLSENYSIRVKDTIKRLKPDKKYNPGVRIIYPSQIEQNFEEAVILTQAGLQETRQGEKKQKERYREKGKARNGGGSVALKPAWQDQHELSQLPPPPPPPMPQLSQKLSPPPPPPSPPLPPPLPSQPFDFAKKPNLDASFPNNYGLEENSNNLTVFLLVCRW